MHQPQPPDIPRKNLLQRLRVPAGFVVGLSFLVLSRPDWITLAAGAPIALAGAAIRAWASGHLRKNAELATGGPYAFTRNPLYFGSLVMVLGCAVAGGRAWLGAGLLGLFLLIYAPVVRTEALQMQRLFGADYEAWAARVPLFWPRASRWRGGLTRHFDSGQYLRHREYRAAAGLVLVFGILSLKATGMFTR
jgi:hypothetical protein